MPSQAHKLLCSLRQIRLECSPCSFTQLLSGNKSGISWPDTENPTSSWYTFTMHMQFFWRQHSCSLHCPVQSLCSWGPAPALQSVEEGSFQSPFSDGNPCTARSIFTLRVYTFRERLWPIRTHQHSQAAELQQSLSIMPMKQSQGRV